MKRYSAIAVSLLLTATLACRAQPSAASPGAACGEVVTIETHGGTTTRYALARPKHPAEQAEPVALVLLAGGGGFLDLDRSGCPHALAGNSLVRSIPIFLDAGFVTALVDAPSDYTGEDGLAGFRIAEQHAQDLGRVIADVRARTKAPVWVLGTSRGSISAANAAARLTGDAAPDGVVLTSALTSGQSGARKAWVVQTVFDLPLEAIRVPLLVVGHAADKCVRSPANLMDRIAARVRGVREQIVTVSGGPGWSGPASTMACEGRAPHGFVTQEAEVAAGIARFIRGGRY